MKFKSLKSILLTTGLVVGISLFSSNVYAATYTTVSGDSLYKISKIFNTSVSSIITDNELTSINLNIGQRLNVSGVTHTVKKGETLYLISKAYNISLDTLRRANNIYTNYIDIGQKLNVPVTSTVSESKALSYSASDLDLLARLITAEAQTQEYKAQVAIGAVVVNRVKYSTFKDTISGVIYEVIDGHYQFTPVLNGWINKPATADSIKAAKEALRGVDPTNGALFYFDNTATNKWLLSRPVSIRIDSMIFTY
jgi:spore germination cell wall hydrolase CwlJ-like protein